jgi:DNA (cytosine-5)-methyltransferase 1
MKGLRFYDAFSGIGGLHLALTQLGHICVGASEIDQECKRVYQDNFSIEPQGDITKIENFPDMDILCSGAPCTSFSNAGNKKGMKDYRGQLFNQVFRIARLKQPKFMFLENVKHIKRIDDGKVFKYILDQLDDCGYRVQTFDISPHHLGVPQNRERVIFACIRKDIPFEPIELKIKKQNISLEDILEKNVKSFDIKPDELQVLEAWESMIKQFEVGETLSPTILANDFYITRTDEEFEDLPKWRQDYLTKNRRIYNKYRSKWDAWYQENREIVSKKEIFGKLEWQTGRVKANESIFNHFIQFRQSGIRVKKADYFPTLVAIVQTPVYARERRYITPRECARLQSFPDTFRIHPVNKTAYKQFGNAVNVEVIKTVVSQIIC